MNKMEEAVKAMTEIKDIPIVTLFMLQSIDGKITTGQYSDDDFDKDLPNIPGVKEGLHQYYELEKETDDWTICTGTTFSKLFFLGDGPALNPILNVLVFDSHHLSNDMIRTLASRCNRLVIATRYQMHKGRALMDKIDNLDIYYMESPMIKDALLYVRNKYGCVNITLQGGAKLNASFLEEDLIDKITLVVAPILIGGDNVTGLIGTSLAEQVVPLRTFKLTEVKQLEDSYLKLCYERIRK